MSSTARRSQGQDPSVQFFRLAQLRKLHRCECVAAVCFRVRGSNIEFLLVQTRKGRWIFPKGSAEPGLTHAQAAALEAFEEAGVHGRMEEASFTRYIHRKGGKMQRPTELTVSAHLCEVMRLVPPPEVNRNPTWFSTEKAKQRLRDDRRRDHGADLARVIDRAVVRILRLRNGLLAAPEVLPPTHSPGAQSKDARQKARLIDIGSVRRTTGRTKTASAG